MYRARSAAYVLLIFSHPRKFIRHPFPNTELHTRITGKISYDDIIDPSTGELLVEKDTEISADVAEAIQNTGINIVDVKVNDKKVRVIGNGTVNIHNFVTDVDISDLHFKEYVNYEVLKSILDTTEPEKLQKELEQEMKKRTIVGESVGLRKDSEKFLKIVLEKKKRKWE